ncbi:hypothetical protein FJ366_02940, partial [Candidatus Dependentiae bacterium]|nr:hypothetical protein [Candidatus Dependentiae bacterium]
MSDNRRASKFFLFFFLIFSHYLASTAVLGDVVYSLPYQWQMRKTSFYDSVQRQLFLGAISKLSTNRLAVGVSAGGVVKSLAPHQLAEAPFVENGYETRSLWDMSLVYKGTDDAPWLLQIMANESGIAPASKMYAVKVDPAQTSPTYFIHTQFLNNSGVASIPFKTCFVERASDSVSAATKKVFVVAIAGSSTDVTFNSASTGACFRLYILDEDGEGMTELAASKLSAAGLGSFSELRDMWWDSSLKRLYCAFARTDETKVGLCAIYLDETTPASPVLKFVNDGELLSSPAGSAKSLIPYVHRVRSFTVNPGDGEPDKKKYLLVCGGGDQYSYNRIYALPLVNRNSASTAAQGKIDTKHNPGTSGSGVTAHDDSWLDQRNDISMLTAGRDALAESPNALSLIAARTVGCGPLPVSPHVPVTDMSVIVQEAKLNVYVSVADDLGRPCLFKTSALFAYNDDSSETELATGKSGKLKGWTPWERVNSTAFNSPIVTFGIDTVGSDRVMVLFDNNHVNEFVGTALPTFAQYPQNSFALVTPTASARAPKLDIADLTTLWRNRRLGLFLPGFNLFYAASANKDMQSNSLVGYGVGGTGQGLTQHFVSHEDILNKAIWTTALHESGILVVTHSEIDETTLNYGGKRLFLVDASRTIFSRNVATDVKDSAGTASRIFALSFVPKATTNGIVLAAIPDAARNDFSSGNNNCIRAFTHTVITTLDSENKPVVTASDMLPYSGTNFVYSLADGSSALALQTGQTGDPLTYRSLEDMYSDPISQITYLAFTKATDGKNSDSDDDAGLVFIGWNDAETGQRYSGKLLEGSVDNTTGFKHILKVRSMYTKTDLEAPANNKSYLIFNGTNHAGVATDGSGQGAVRLNKIYALPLVSSGTHRGKIATDSTHATAAVLAPQTWSETADSAANYAKHVVGGGYLPTHQRSVVTDILVSGRAVFVSVANPQGVTGRRGVFVSQALTDLDENLVGWTEWQCIGGANENIASLGYDASTDTLIAVNHDSSFIQKIGWNTNEKITGVNSSRQNIYSFARALQEDFSAGTSKMYGMQFMSCYSNDHQDSTHLFGAFGYNKIALGFCTKNVGAFAVGSFRYPYKLDPTKYMVFAQDTDLDQIKSIYCIAAAPRLPGWVFAGGYRGLAVLRNGSNGRGWTSLPGSFADTNSGAYTALNSQTWKVLSAVSGPVYKILVTTTVVNETSALAPLVICMGRQGLTGFVATEGKFKDSSPEALEAFNTAEIFTDPGEYMRDIALIGGKMFLVGTNKGLYLMQVSDTNDSFVASPTRIKYQGALMGPIGAIKVTASVAGSSTTLNPTGLNDKWFFVDVLTSRLRKNQSEHYQFKVKLNSSGVLPEGG